MFKVPLPTSEAETPETPTTPAAPTSFDFPPESGITFKEAKDEPVQKILAEYPAGGMPLEFILSSHDPNPQPTPAPATSQAAGSTLETGTSPFIKVLPAPAVEPTIPVSPEGDPDAAPKSTASSSPSVAKTVAGVVADSGNESMDSLIAALAEGENNIFSSEGQEILKRIFLSCFDHRTQVLGQTNTILPDDQEVTDENMFSIILENIETLKSTGKWSKLTGFNQESWDKVAPYLKFLDQKPHEIVNLPRITPATEDAILAELFSENFSPQNFSQIIRDARRIRDKLRESFPSRVISPEQLAWIFALTPTYGGKEDRTKRDAVRYLSGIDEYDVMKAINFSLEGINQKEKCLFFYQHPGWLEDEASKIKAEIEGKKSSESNKIKTFHGALNDKKDLLETKKTEKKELESAFDEKDLRFVSQFFYDFSLILQSEPDFGEVIQHAMKDHVQKCLEAYPDIARAASDIKNLTSEIDTEEKALESRISEDATIGGLRIEIASLEKNLETLENIKHSLTQNNQEQASQ